MGHISKITSNYSAILKLKAELPQKLAKRGLLINESKTEEYTIRIKNSCNLKWKKWKLLGSLLDSESDIKRRNSLAINAASNLTKIFENNKISISTKTGAFKTYIDSIFLSVTRRHGQKTIKYTN